MTSDVEGAGLLLAMMEPPSAFDEEFQDWYDNEHFPERKNTDGFETATRLICVDGWPRYLALYDLTHVNVLRGESYAKIAGSNYSRWTHRVIPKVWGHYRAEGTQIYPGRARFGDAGKASRVSLWRFSDVAADLEPFVTEGLKAIYSHRPETAQIRIFKSERQGATDYIGIVELYAPCVPEPEATERLGDARKHLDMVNSYTRYFRN